VVVKIVVVGVVGVRAPKFLGALPQVYLISWPAGGVVQWLQGAELCMPLCSRTKAPEPHSCAERSLIWEAQLSRCRTYPVRYQDFDPTGFIFVACELRLCGGCD
jgi:hypothetical protein